MSNQRKPTVGKALDRIQQLRNTREKRLAEARKKLEQKHARELAQLPEKLKVADGAREAAILDALGDDAKSDMVLTALRSLESQGKSNPLKAAVADWKKGNGDG